MAIFKPEVKSNSNFTSFTGICELGITGFEDKSQDFDWADLFLEISVKQKDSEYERKTQIKGNFEKEGGKITGGSCLKRLYQFFDEIGCEAGINTDGGWEDETGKEIEDIAKYLNDNFVKPSKDYEPPMDFIGYFYKEQPKKPGKTAYNKAHYKLYPVGGDNENKLKNDIDWMKSKGYIKEYDEEVKEVALEDLSSLALDNL